MNKITIGNYDYPLDAKVCFVMVGLPCSGKTTFIKNILGEDLYNKHVVSTDHIIERQAKKQNKTYSEIFHRNIKSATKQMYAKLDSLIKKQNLIIWDQTNLGKGKRKKILNKLSGYEVHAIYFPVDPHELNKRLKKRNKTGKVIPNSLIKSMKRNLEIPTKEEGFDEVWFNE